MTVSLNRDSNVAKRINILADIQIQSHIIIVRFNRREKICLHFHYSLKTFLHPAVLHTSSQFGENKINSTLFIFNYLQKKRWNTSTRKLLFLSLCDQHHIITHSRFIVYFSAGSRSFGQMNRTIAYYTKKDEYTLLSFKKTLYSFFP